MATWAGPGVLSWRAWRGRPSRTWRRERCAERCAPLGFGVTWPRGGSLCLRLAAAALARCSSSPWPPPARACTGGAPTCTGRWGRAAACSREVPRRCGRPRAWRARWPAATARGRCWLWWQVRPARPGEGGGERECGLPCALTLRHTPWTMLACAHANGSQGTSTPWPSPRLRTPRPRQATARRPLLARTLAQASVRCGQRALRPAAAAAPDLPPIRARPLLAQARAARLRTSQRPIQLRGTRAARSWNSSSSSSSSSSRWVVGAHVRARR